MKPFKSVRYHDILKKIALQAAEVKVKVIVTVNRKMFVIALLTTYLTILREGIRIVCNALLIWVCDSSLNINVHFYTTYTSSAPLSCDFSFNWLIKSLI